MLDNVGQLPTPANDADPFAKYNTHESPILFPVAEREVAWRGREQWWPTRHHKAIIRLNEQGDSPRLLNIVGDGYKLVHNRELFTRVEDTMRNQMLPEHLEGVRVTDKVAYLGRVCYRDYVFPNISCRVGRGGSDIAFRIIVQNGYGGSALRIHAGAIDFYCTNGMIRGEYSTSYRKHTKGLMVDNLSAVVTKALLGFSVAQQTWEDWANKPVKVGDITAFFEKIATSKQMRDGFADQYMHERAERGQNLWAVYSTLTYYASHNEGPFAMRRRSDEVDSANATMMQREINVSRWIETPEWKAMEIA